MKAGNIWKEKKKESAFDEVKINKFLDKILEFKRRFINKTNKINVLVEKIESITWFTNLDNESLMSINDLISSVRDLHSSLLRQYISLNFIRTKGIATEEIKNFKGSIDDLKDIKHKFESIQSEDKIVLTTEKDAVRLTKFRDEIKDMPFYVLPVRHRFLFEEAEIFNTIITKFINEFTNN